MRSGIIDNGYMSTDGEKFLINFLNENLLENFEIYTQPNLNGNRPDIVLFHKNKGVFIIEIKDWKLERFEKDYIRNKFYKNYNNKKIEIANPNSQLRRYKMQFDEFDIPIICIHYFHNSTTQDAIDFLGENGINIFGFDEKKKLIDFIQSYKNTFITFSDTIRNFIFPKKHKKENGKKIIFNQQQKNL